MKRVEVVAEVPRAKNQLNLGYATVAAEVIELKAGSWAVYQCKDAEEASGLAAAMKNRGVRAHVRKSRVYIATGPANGAKP